jgi:hypothetical protein
MNSVVVVENIIQTGVWVCDNLERAKKARLLPDDVWGLIKSYAIPPNKCACCNKVGERTFCLPNFHYSTKIRKLDDASIKSGLLERREKLTYDDVVVDKKFESVRVCYDCSGKLCRAIKNEGIHFNVRDINNTNVQIACINVGRLFDFSTEDGIPKSQINRTKNRTIKYFFTNPFDTNPFDPPSPDNFSQLLVQLHSHWRDFVKKNKAHQKRLFGEGKVDKFNEQIDDLIRCDMEGQISDKYKGLFLKTIATAFAIGKLDIKNYMELTADIIPKYRVCRTEEEGIEKLTRLQEISGIKL